MVITNPINVATFITGTYAENSPFYIELLKEFDCCSVNLFIFLFVTINILMQSYTLSYLTI